jgi:hypothetical protein
MSENSQIQNEEEISLLDLFTVVLRYRKLVIGITLAFIVFAFAGYFIIPVFQYKKAKSKLMAQGLIQMEIVTKARPYISQSLDNFILRSDIIYDSLNTAGMKDFSYPGGQISFNDDNKVNIMYLIDIFWIKNLDFKGDTYNKKDHEKLFYVKRTGTSTGTNTNINTSTSSVYEISLKDKDPELIEKFLYLIYKSCSVNVENNLRASAQMIVSNYERLLQITGASESIKTIIEKDFDNYIYFKDFLAGKEEVVRLVSEPVLVEGFISLSLFQKQYPGTGIIIGFVGLFLAVITAFILNGIRSIKKDEEAMNKIRDALGNSVSK